jgi:hypothetical protein
MHLRGSSIHEVRSTHAKIDGEKRRGKNLQATQQLLCGGQVIRT